MAASQSPSHKIKIAYRSYPEVGDHSIRVVLFIECIDQERLVLIPILDGCRRLREELLGGIHKNLVQVLLLAYLIE